MKGVYVKLEEVGGKVRTMQMRSEGQAVEYVHEFGKSLVQLSCYAREVLEVDGLTLPGFRRLWNWKSGRNA
jgi:uncharacterized protein YjhX (UPF0386 family)